MVDQTPKAVIGLIITSLIFVWVYVDYIPLPYLLLWLGAQILFILFRFLNAKTLKKLIANDDTVQMKRHITYFMALLIYSTLVWTSATLLGLLFAPPYYEFVSLIMIVGIVTAGSLSLSSIFYAYIIYFLLMLLPQIAIMIYHATQIHTAIALFLLLSIPILMFLSKTIYSTFLHSITTYESLETTVSELHVDSITDSLTHTFNRRHFFKVAQHAIALAQHSQRPLSLLMIDIDFFKEVNDTYGHQAGDAILIAFSSTIKSAIREDDIFARIGGEEFTLLLQNSTLTEAVVIANKLREIVHQRPFMYNDVPINITISIGVSTSSPQINTINALYETADLELYRAKKLGRNRVCSI
jgi:diguanylate cyclase (GGDEF)-like protein